MSDGTVSITPDTPKQLQTLADLEHEFIRGNRDGPDGCNDTYTVCRLRVSRERLDGEMKQGMHPNFFTMSSCWDCPAHVYLSAWLKYVKRRPTGTRVRRPPAAASMEDWKRSGLTNRPAQALELVQRDPDRPPQRQTFTICRVAVPRERLVREVEAGLHPGYHVRRTKSGRPFVQGNPTDVFDNVDEPKSLKAKPGFSTQQLCPYRLLRPGPQLLA